MIKEKLKTLNKLPLLEQEIRIVKDEAIKWVKEKKYQGLYYESMRGFITHMRV